MKASPLTSEPPHSKLTMTTKITDFHGQMATLVRVAERQTTYTEIPTCQQQQIKPRLSPLVTVVRQLNPYQAVGGLAS
jgi:hypothetical protein